jgi:cobyrinic acid a,c-diamide synthase
MKKGCKMASVGKGLMISAPKKSSGKTTVTLGLTSALTSKGKKLRIYKKGPDYIDPMWHKAASGNTCYNIDPFWMDERQCQRAFYSRARGMDLCLVEGNHGLHDGLDLNGSNSGAALAKLLNVPVLLVVDGIGANRGIAAVVLGHQMLDKEVDVSGVILNNVATSRQASKQQAAFEYYCGIPVIGALPRSSDIGIKERHLGLVTVHENSAVDEVIKGLGKVVAENCDLEKVMSIAGALTPPKELELYPDPPDKGFPSVKIGVAYDSSFCFYYPENLGALEAAGAELVYFDTLNDNNLPEVDGVYIGGGFPESFLPELENNKTLRQQLYERISQGLPVYAECGGLMYLTRSIERHGIKKEMVGAIPADVLFQDKPVGKGYAELVVRNTQDWFNNSQVVKGHEFHYSRLINLDQELDYKFDIVRGTGIDGKRDGILHRNILASYTHIHADVVVNWAESFVSFVKKIAFSR